MIEYILPVMNTKSTRKSAMRKREQVSNEKNEEIRADFVYICCVVSGGCADIQNGRKKIYSF